jgi:hypothetical protein
MFAFNPELTSANAAAIWRLWFDEMTERERFNAAALAQLNKVSDPSNGWGVTIGGDAPLGGSNHLLDQRVKVWFSTTRGGLGVGGPRHRLEYPLVMTGSREPCRHKKLYGLTMVCCHKVVCTPCYAGFVAARKCECGVTEDGIKAPRAQTARLSPEMIRFLACLTGRERRLHHLATLLRHNPLPSREEAYAAVCRLEGGSINVVQRSLEEDADWLESTSDVRAAFMAHLNDAHQVIPVVRPPPVPQAPRAAPVFDDDEVPRRAESKERAKAELAAKLDPQTRWVVAQGLEVRLSVERWDVKSTRPEVKYPDGECGLCLAESANRGVLECCRQTVCAGCFAEMTLTGGVRCPFCRTAAVGRVPPLRLEKPRPKRARPQDAALSVLGELLG